MSIFSDEVRDYFYSLENPCFESIKFITAKIASFDYIIREYKNTLKDNLYTNKPFEEIVITLPFDLDIDENKTLDYFFRDSNLLEPIFNTYMLYHYDMGNVYITRIDKLIDKLFITFRYCHDMYGEQTKVGVGINLKNMVVMLKDNIKEK